MYKPAKGILIALVVFVLSISGCNNAQPSSNDNVSGNPFQEHQDGQDGILRINHGVIDPDPQTGKLVYNGAPVSCTYMLNNEGSKAEWGIVIYVNGVQQPYAVDNMDEEKVCHVFTVEEHSRRDVKIVFTPIIGKSGQDLSVIFATVLKPSYVLDEKEISTGYGYYHSHSTGLTMQLIMNQDAPGGGSVDVLSGKATVGSNIPEWADGSNETEVFLDGDKEAVYAKSDTDAKLMLSIIGRDNHKYRVSFYINHHLIPVFNGHSYLDLDIQKDKICTYDIAVSSKHMANAKFAYVVIAPVLEKFDSDPSLRLKKSPTKAILFKEPPESTTRDITSAAQTSPPSISSDLPSINTKIFHKETGILASPAPSQELSNFYMLDNHRALIYFKPNQAGEGWCGIYDFNKQKYDVYQPNMLLSGAFQPLKEGFCIYEHRTRPIALKAIHIYSNQLKLVKSIDFSQANNAPQSINYRLSYEGNEFAYITNEKDTSTIYICGLDLRNPKKVYEHKASHKTGELSRINTIQNFVGNTLVFSGNAHTPSETTLMGIGSVTTAGKNLRFQTQGYAWFDTFSTKRTLVYGAQDMYDKVFSGKAYVLDHETQEILKLQFKNKKESGQVILSINGRYAITFVDDPNWIMRLYEVQTSNCIKEWEMSSEPSEAKSPASSVSIDDDSRKIYVLIGGTLYTASF